MKVTIEKGLSIALLPPAKYAVKYKDTEVAYQEPMLKVSADKQILKKYATGEISALGALKVCLLKADPGLHGRNTRVTTPLTALLSLIEIVPAIEQDKVIVVDSDGNLTLLIAYHFLGNDHAGVDPFVRSSTSAAIHSWTPLVNGCLRSLTELKPVVREAAVMAEGTDELTTKVHYEIKAFNPITLQDLMKDIPELPTVSEPGYAAGDAVELEARSSFYKDFSYCMGLQNLPVPTTLFGNVQSAVASINAIYALGRALGTSVTFAELVGAGALSDKFLVLGTASAAYYLGACIGCGIYAGIGHLIPSS